MLKNVNLKPITGTFVNMLISDTGIINAGLKEWEQDFRMMKAIGMDQLFIIRTEVERDGVYISAEDPRSTTWEEDDCLLDMVFRLADKYDMTLYLGGPLNHTNLFLGDWKKEVEETKKYYDRIIPKYISHPCFKGLYVSLEALPWHFNFTEICTEVLKYMRSNYPQMKTFMSPILMGPTGSRTNLYTADQWVDIFGRYFFEGVAGMLDYCAPQDAFAAPMCRNGVISSNGLQEWYVKMKDLFDRCGIEFWSNVETFQRPFAANPDTSGLFRQADYRTLYAKLQEASPYVERIITYEYFSCLSPNTEWGSSRRLLARYMEMIGKDPAKINEIYG